MSGGFDADDMMRRGLFSSIMGFKKKPARPLENRRPSASVCSSSRDAIPVVTERERTQHDIFREIVNECESIERSNTTTPFSELTSCPTSPLASLSLDLNHHFSPQTIHFGPQNPQQQQPGPHLQPLPMHYHPHPMSPIPYADAMSFSPPPYSPVDGPSYPQPSLYLPGLAPPPPPPLPHHHHNHQQQQMMMPQQPHDLQNSALIEEVVKMVVNAMRQSSIGGEQKESPEEILRRKRVQNNEAAARYRKRQRDARDRAETELEGLARKNDHLRDTVSRMEHEIDQLKRAVLGGGVPKS